MDCLMHVSDCAIYDGGNHCDCGELDLASYESHCFVPTFIAATGCFGFFVDHMGRECFVEPEQLPTDTLAALASAANLPSAHNIVAILGGSDRMNLDDARKAVISEFQSLTRLQCATGDRGMHHRSPSKADGEHYHKSDGGLQSA